MSDFIDLSAVAPTLANSRALQNFVEAVSTDLRNEIVLQMDPGPARTGHEYTVRGTGTIDKETGKRKKGTGTKYTASAPGEPPAVQTGTYRDSWQVIPPTVTGTQIRGGAMNTRKTEDGAHFIGEILEYGTDRATMPGGGGTVLGYTTAIAPRPHIRPAMEIVAERWKGRLGS